MTPGQALKTVRDAAAGRVRLQFSGHAVDRLDERCITKADAIRVLATTFAIADQLDGTWRVTGKRLDGRDLTLIVAVERGVVVVTIWKGGRR